MAPNERARKNHEELFPGHVSTLSLTDPELIETFDNFAFDEVLRDSRLDMRTRLMVQLAAIIASQALGEYRVMVGAALNVGVTPGWRSAGATRRCGDTSRRTSTSATAEGASSTWSRSFCRSSDTRGRSTG
jgi:hypothetical protein